MLTLRVPPGASVTGKVKATLAVKAALPAPLKPVTVRGAVPVLVSTNTTAPELPPTATEPKL